MGQPRPAFYERGIGVADAEVTNNGHEGALFTYMDEDNQPLIMKLVKNNTGGAVLPRIAYKYGSATVNSQVDGVATASAEAAGVADSEIPAAGIADGKWFLVAVKGVHDVTATGVIAIGARLVSDAAGKATTSGATPTYFTMGRAIEAGTADAATKALLDILG